MKNIKDYDLEDLKKELVEIGENHLEQSKYLNGCIKKK